MPSRSVLHNEDAGHPMSDRVWQQEDRLCRMLDKLQIPAGVAARSHAGADFEKAAETCLSCWTPACESFLTGDDGLWLHEFCPNWPMLALWLEQTAWGSHDGSDLTS